MSIISGMLRKNEDGLKLDLDGELDGVHKLPMIYIS